MPSSERPSESQIPLVVDLDGTLIKTDLLWESLARLLRRNPFQLFPVLLWWTTGGRAFLKRKLAARVTIDPATLPFNEPFLAFLREQKRAGRKLVLATASDREMALPVANYLDLFDQVLGSDGKTNLRGANKLKALTEKFGERGFDYAGNGVPDLAVWRGAREAIVVNASCALAKQAGQITTLGPTFIEDYSPFGTLKSFLRELFWRSGYLVAVCAGLLLAAAFPKIGIAGFAWIAPGLMIAATRGERGGDAFRVGYVAGLACFLSSLYWLLLMPVTGLPILAWLALGAYLALYPAVWVWLMCWWNERPREPWVGSSRRDDRKHTRTARRAGLSEVFGSREFPPHQSWTSHTLWSLGGAAAWVALEMVRARLFTGFPWNFVGVSQYKMVPLIQIASVAGVHGVSFLVVWFSLALYSAACLILQRPNTRLLWQAGIILPFLVVVALFVFGFAHLSNESPPELSLRVTLVQPSIPQTLIWNPDEDERRFQKLLVQSQDALTNQTDLLLWPESAVPETDEATCRTISRFAQSNRVWLILNGEDAEYLPDKTNYFNAAYLVGPDGRWLQVYHKRKLVVFGEYIPLEHWLPFVKYLTPITDGWTPGNKPVTFEITRRSERTREPIIELNTGSSAASAHQTINVSPLICFEDVFPSLARDAVNGDTDFLVNLTNDGWFRQSAEQWQHMANAVFRAVENGRPLVCCANNGITCWVDANGRVRKIFKDKTGSVYGVGAMTVQIPIVERQVQTFYDRHGDWFGWACVILAAAMAVREIFIRRK